QRASHRRYERRRPRQGRHASARRPRDDHGTEPAEGPERLVARRRRVPLHGSHPPHVSPARGALRARRRRARRRGRDPERHRGAPGGSIEKDTEVRPVLAPSTKEAVTGTAATPVIDTKGTTVAQVTSVEQITKLPIGRTFTGTFQLAPGVADSNVQVSAINTGV